MLDLAGLWSVTDGDGQFTAPMRLPGDVHSALLAAGLIPDPYHGRNEVDLRWVADRDWTLSRSFEHSGEGPATLLIDVVDTDRRDPHQRPRGLAHRLGLPPGRRRCRARAGSGREPHRHRPALVHPRRRCAGRRAAVPGPLPRRQLPDPERQHAAQAAVRLRLGLEHRPRARRRPWPHRPRRPRGPDRRGVGPPDAWRRRRHARNRRRAPRLRRRHRPLERRRLRPAGDRRGRGRGRLQPRPRPAHDRGSGALVAGRPRPAAAARPRGPRRQHHPHAQARAPRHPPRLRARRHRPQLRAPRQRPPGLRPRRQLDPGRRAARPHHRGEDPRPPAVGRRRQHEHDPRLGRRPLRARELLRDLRRPRPPRLAGPHVRLPPLSRHRRVPRRASTREVTHQARRIGHHVALWCGDNELLGALGWFEESRAATATATSSPTTA